MRRLRPPDRCVGREPALAHEDRHEHRPSQPAASTASADPGHSWPWPASSLRVSSVAWRRRASRAQVDRRRGLPRGEIEIKPGAGDHRRRQYRRPADPGGALPLLRDQPGARARPRSTRGMRLDIAAGTAFASSPARRRGRAVLGGAAWCSGSIRRSMGSLIFHTFRHRYGNRRKYARSPMARYDAKTSRKGRPRSARCGKSVSSPADGANVTSSAGDVRVIAKRRAAGIRDSSPMAVDPSTSTGHQRSRLAAAPKRPRRSMIGVDTNILLRHILADDPKWSEKSSRFLTLTFVRLKTRL